MEDFNVFDMEHAIDMAIKYMKMTRNEWNRFEKSLNQQQGDILDAGLEELDTETDNRSYDAISDALRRINDIRKEFDADGAKNLNDFQVALPMATMMEIVKFFDTGLTGLPAYRQAVDAIFDSFTILDDVWKKFDSDGAHGMNEYELAVLLAILKIIETQMIYDEHKDQQDQEYQNNESERKALVKLFDRTMRNCYFYEREGRDADLLNEIGVLRGLAYAMEEVGIHQYDGEYYRFIDIQNHLKPI